MIHQVVFAASFGACMNGMYGIEYSYQRLKRKTQQRDCDVVSVFQTYYFTIGTAYQRDNVHERDRQRDFFQNCHIFLARHAGRRAGRCGGCRASYVALDVASVVALVGGQSRDCRAIVASHVACQIALALTLVCFAIQGVGTVVVRRQWGVHKN